jgi:class 3 adenylate cyclase
MKSGLRTYLILSLINIPFLIIGTICLLNAISWIGKPFQGFLLYQVPYVGVLGNPTWSGPKAGLALMDKIISVNGIPIREGKDLLQLIEENKVEEPLLYEVVTGGVKRYITIPLETFTFLDFIIVYFLSFLCSLALLTIGSIVCLLKPGVSSSWVFFTFCFIVGLYIITGFDIQSTYSFVFVHNFFIPFQGAVVLHLGLIFPEPQKFYQRFPWIKYFVYLPAVILGTIFEAIFLTSREVWSFLNPWLPSLPQAITITRIFIVLGVIGFMSFVISSYFRTSSNVVKQRAKMIFFGVTLAFFPTVLLFLLVNLTRTNFPMNLTVYLILSFPASMAYAIIRHNLFDADTLIRRTVGYAVVTAVLIGSYLLVSLGLNFIMGGTSVAHSRAFPILFTILFILVFNPLRNRIQTVVDRLFFRKEYDAKQIIDRIGTAITSLMDLPQILRQLVSAFSQDMFIDNSAVLLLNHSGTAYHVCHSEGEKQLEMEGITFHKTEPLPQLIEKEKKEITKYDVLENQKYNDICLDCAQNFSTLHASLIIPMVLRGEVIGFFSLGDKKSGKSYNREDVDLLHTLAGQGAVAIENAHLADQMKNEELVRANLARYLSPQIVDQIIRNDVQVNLGGDRKEVTVLFSDIRNFTSISESMKPDQLVRFLNEYFTEMARIIFNNHGSLDKYIGDAIIAIFGSLIPLENPAEAAVQASVEMMREMVHLNENWKDQYGFNMEMGIGLNTGEVFLGNIGSPERMEFTIIGDPVNTASRLSSLARGRQILVTESTRNQLGSGFKINQLPPAQVKGKSGMVVVFEVDY